MELIAILLSSVLAFAANAGWFIEHAIFNAFRSRFQEVEQLEVRVDNKPNSQIFQGHIDGIFIASRGVKPIPNLRIEALELETDPIEIDLKNFRKQGISAFQESLKKPLNGGIRLVVTETDINQALQSEAIITRIEEVINKLRGNSSRKYELLNPQIDLLGDNRLKIMLQLRRSQETEPLNINLELGLTVVDGTRIEIIEPMGTVNGRQLSSRVLNGLAERIGSRLDLRKLEETGTIARILQLDGTQDLLQGAAIFRLPNVMPVETSRLNVST